LWINNQISLLNLTCYTVTVPTIFSRKSLDVHNTCTYPTNCWFDQTAHYRISDFVLLPLSMFTLPNFVCGLNLEWSGKGIRWTCVEVCQGSEWEPCGTEVYWVCWPILSSVYYWCFSSSGNYVFHVIIIWVLCSACMYIFRKMFCLYSVPALLKGWVTKWLINHFP